MFPIRDHNPSNRAPYVTYGLIALNIAVYIWGFSAMATDQQVAQIYFRYAVIPARLIEGDGFIALITAQFLHAGFFHLAGNMLFLWIFGDNLEDKFGHMKFLGFYLLGGVAASLMHVASEPGSPVPLIGASGAIAAVMGGYLLLFPKAKVDIFIFLIIIFRIFPIPAWLMLGLWFALQMVNGLGNDAASGVAYWAHIGGFVVGLIMCVPLWRRLGGAQFWRHTDYHPDHPEATYRIGKTTIPSVRR
jgi:membrane associated rhomboid family serine protease